MRRTLSLTVLAVVLACALPCTASADWSYPFDYVQGCNGLITNEYAGWHPSDPLAVRSAYWRSDGGSLFSVWADRPTRVGYTGALDSTQADRCSTHTHSNKMRFWTRQVYGDGLVQTDIRPLGFSSSAPASWAGFKFYLRRQLDETHSAFYTAEPYILDGHVYIQKKCLGDTGGGNYVEGGTYYLLAQRSGLTVPSGWHVVAATTRTNPDGSVSIALYRDGVLTLEATDTGRGCAPLGPGRIGFRSDFMRYYLDNFTDTALP